MKTEDCSHCSINIYFLVCSVILKHMHLTQNVAYFRVNSFKVNDFRKTAKLRFVESKNYLLNNVLNLN